MDEDDAVGEVGDEVVNLDIARGEFVIQPTYFINTALQYMSSRYISPFRERLRLHFHPCLIE